MVPVRTPAYLRQATSMLSPSPVLLTIALIMRANYSVTSQRRWDRVTGTAIGPLAVP